MKSNVGGIDRTLRIALGLGLVLMLLWWTVHPDYFRGQTLPKRAAHEFVLAGPHTDHTSVRLPDSGLPELVIAPDLSNLPPGQHAVDLTSHEVLDAPEDGGVPRT